MVQCAKCQKWVTPKTLKYTHSLKCGVVKKSRPNKSEIKINEIVQEEAPPPPAPPPPPIQKVIKDKQPPVQRTQPPKPIEKTFEQMRKERLTEYLKQRAERNINLFKQVL